MLNIKRYDTPHVAHLKHLEPDRKHHHHHHPTQLRHHTDPFDSTDTFGIELSEAAHKGLIALKATFLIIACLAFWKFGYESHQRKYEPPTMCVEDYIFERLETLNQDIHANLVLRRALQISSSLLVDINFLYFLLTSIPRMQNGHHIYAGILFYGVRAIIQANYSLQFPKGNIWDYPGIPSLTVPYGLTRDFYYSGHCGFLTVVSYFHLRERRVKSAIFSALCITYVGFVLLLFRIHYSIDIPIGIFAGMYFPYIAKFLPNKVNPILKKVLCARFWHNVCFGPHFGEDEGFEDEEIDYVDTGMDEVVCCEDSHLKVREVEDEDNSSASLGEELPPKEEEEYTV